MSTPCEGVTDLWSLTEVTCNYADFKVKVPKCVFDETIFDGSPLTELLKDDLFISGSARPGTKCFGKIDDADKFVFFDVGKNPDTCQVRREPRTYTERPNHNKVLEYSANIQYSIGSANSVISRTRSINLPFFCHFPLDFKVSEDTKLKAKRQEIRYKVKGEVVTTEIVSGLFKDETWDTQLAGDQVFEVPTPIHVGFSTPNDSDKFKIKLKKCWATPESNPNHDTKYVFLDNWCGKKAELDGKTLEVYNLEHAAGFAIEAFTWKDQTCSDIFLHCEIELCLVGQDCDTAPVCQKDRKRRETEEKKTVVGGNKVRVCGDATFPLKEKKCPKELELQFPTRSEAEGTYEWIEDENEYRKKGSHWAIFKREKGAKTDWIVRFGTGMFYQATGDCPVSDEYLDIENHVTAQGFKVIAKGGKEEEKKTCPEKVDLKWPKSGNPGIEGTYTLDKNDKSYRKPNSDWSFKLVQEDYWIHKADLPKFSTEGNCPVSDSYKNTLMQPVTGLEVTEHKEEESGKKECPLEVQVEFPDFPDMEGVYVRGELTKNYVKAGSKWSIISNNGAMVFVKDGSGVYGSGGDCPVGLLYNNNGGVNIPKLKVTAKEEKKGKEEERKLEVITCPEKVDLKWPKSGNPGIEGTYTLDKNDKSYRKPNSDWSFKLVQEDYWIHKADLPKFSTEGNCPVSDSYKNTLMQPVTGLEVTEHKEQENKEKEKCPQKVTVIYEKNPLASGDYLLNSEGDAYERDFFIIKKNIDTGVWQLGGLNPDGVFEGHGLETEDKADCPTGTDWIRTAGPPEAGTIEVVVAEEKEKCPQKVTVSFEKDFPGSEHVEGEYVFNSDIGAYTDGRNQVKKNNYKNVWQLGTLGKNDVFSPFGLETKTAAACPSVADWVKIDGPPNSETIKVVAVEEKGLPAVQFSETSGNFVPGKVLATDIVMGKEWELSVDLKFEQEPRSPEGYISVFHFSKEADRSPLRVPAVQLKDDRTLRTLNWLNENQGQVFFDTTSPMGTEWFNFKLQQRKETDESYVFEVLIDDAVLYSVTNDDPQVFESVTAEFSSSESDNRWPASTGQFRNLALSAEGNPVVVAEEKEKVKCPQTVTVSFGKDYQQFFQVFSGDYVLNSEGDTYQIQGLNSGSTNAYLKKVKETNIWQLSEITFEGKFGSLGAQTKIATDCPVGAEWGKTDGPVGIETITVVAKQEGQ